MWLAVFQHFVLVRIQGSDKMAKGSIRVEEFCGAALLTARQPGSRKSGRLDLGKRCTFRSMTQ